MRLWSIHPGYLDAKGLLAVWREGLLAKKALENRTRGYRNHPQLIRFKAYKNPASAINAYLFEIYKEAGKRGYGFDSRKIRKRRAVGIIGVTSKQIRFEFDHLLGKLRKRDRERFERLKRLKKIKANPVFRITRGEIEPWEKTKGK